MPISVRIDRDIVLEPDLLSIRHGSKADNLETTCIEGPPTLMIKILPKSTASRDLNRKREMYEQYGVEEYWIVDSLERAITALQLADRRHQPIPNRTIASPLWQFLGLKSTSRSFSPGRSRPGR